MDPIAVGSETFSRIRGKIISDPGSSGSEMSFKTNYSDNIKFDIISTNDQFNLLKIFISFYLKIICNLTHLQDGDKGKIFVKKILEKIHVGSEII